MAASGDSDDPAGRDPAARRGPEAATDAAASDAATSPDAAAGRDVAAVPDERARRGADGAGDAGGRREGRRDDRLALVTIALGAATALLGVRAPLMLSTGVALGIAGVLLAVRGDRPIPAPRLMALALTLAVVAVVAISLLGLWEEWLVGQRLSEGAAPDYVRLLMRPYARLGAALRSLSLFAALSMLLGAVTTRLSSSGK